MTTIELGATDGETDYNGDEALHAPKDDMAHTMDTKMAMILDLSQKVHASVVLQRERAASPLGSPSILHDDQRRAIRQTTPTHGSDVSEVVRRRVQQRLWQIPLDDEGSSDNNTSK